MKAVTVDELLSPRYGEFREPVAQDGGVVVQVRAAALTNLDVGIAEGRHYFKPDRYPAVVGREAVVLGPSGRLYLNVKAIPVPFGSMAEYAVADLANGLPVPDGIPDDLAAALGNAGLAGWLPLSWRARLRKGETVLVLGATGTTGQIAVAAASLLGAGRVVAVGRDPETLERLLSSGADAVVRLEETDDLLRAYRDAAGGEIDVVVDYLNGPPAETALATMSVGGRLVQVGSTLAPGILLHAQTARRQSLDVLGFAYYHAPIEEQAEAYRRLCEAAMSGKVTVNRMPLPLSEFARAWAGQKAADGRRYVLQP
jgi:NADPH:quinone reductase-like Zn-dependent oxidoreductase